MGAFADPRFRRLLIGGSLSSLGDSALFLSLGIWAKDLTGNNGAAGAIFLAQGAPQLLAPLTGQLIDRMNRRRLLIVVNALAGIAVLSLLGIRSPSQIWVMYVVAVLYGTAFMITGPATEGLLKDILADQELPTANAAISTVGQGTRIVSPLIGAALFANFGGSSVALLDAATFVVAIAMLATIRVDESPIPPATQVSVQDRLLVGLRYLSQTPVLRQIMIGAVMTMLVIGFYESLTFAVIDAIGRSPSFLGVLMCVQAAGSIAGGLAATRVIRAIGENRALALAMILWAVASIVYTVTSLPLIFMALIIFGIGVSLFAVSLGTAIQRFTPPRLLGRVGSTSNMLTNVSQTLSIATGAALIGFVNYRILLLAIAVAAVAAALPVLIQTAKPPEPGPVA